MNAKHLLLVCPFLITIACNEKKKFGGDVAAKKAPVEKPIEDSETEVIPSTPGRSDDSMPTPDPDETAEETPEIKPVIPKCDVGQSEIANISLLTKGVNFALEDQIIKYEISITSCKDGSAIPLNDQSIYFDLDMHYQGSLPSVGYKILESSTNKAIISGDLGTVAGSDLFGKTGSGFRHWKTEDVSFSSKVEKIILEIDLKKAKMNTQKESDTRVDSFLRMGKASPVTQTIDVLGQPEVSRRR